MLGMFTCGAETMIRCLLRFDLLGLLCSCRLLSLGLVTLVLWLHPLHHP